MSRATFDPGLIGIEMLSRIPECFDTKTRHVFFRCEEASTVLIINLSTAQTSGLKAFCSNIFCVLFLFS
jgi:hypothetical protein